ncbi:MAG: thiamine-monophosphate kinase [Planctomycetaceae bacterium]|nr:thiamine-monophosphate kinase [Planctomycetaceae bacterium]
METELIARLRQQLPSHPLLKLGIGDDAAILDGAQGADWVVTVDMLTDQVDFLLDRVDPRRVGRKALAVNLSDLAAMASRPVAAVVALVLPRKGGMELALALYEGMIPLAEEFGIAIAGGDTNSWDGPLAVSVTAIGHTTARGPLRRDGARPGDLIVVTGRLGGSILGRHFDFQPRVGEALALAERYSLHAGIDISDGLARDLAHLVEESGCGAVVDLASVPISEDAVRLSDQRADGMTPLDHALADGEDFELILAVPAEEAERLIAEQPLDVPVTMIGRFVAEAGLWQQDSSGHRSPMPVRGFEHDLT